MRKLVALLGSSLVVALVACGGPPEPSGFGDREDTPKATGTGGTGQLGGTGGTDQGTGGTTGDDFTSCATQQATAEAKPVYLVFMMDRSGSMVDFNSPKWNSCKAATKAFFSDPASAGVNASLHYFPINGSNPSCNSGDYAKPAVAMTALPNAQLGASLDAQKPQGGTPTEPAIQGALNYARDLGTGQAKDGKVVVVLVTDGIPDGCSSDINGASQIAKGQAQTIPTYVIGVGNVNGLNQIAEAGGTKQAFIVSTNNADQIKADFQKAITEIKLSALSCDYKIPAPPNGQTLDRSKVNVLYKPASGAEQTLPYDQSCGTGKGWRYDDPANPTRILVCDGSCNAIKAAPGKVDVLFGCQTKGGGVN